MKAQTQIKSKLSSGLAYIEDHRAKKNTSNQMHQKVITKNSGAQLRVVNSFRRMHSDKDKITISATSPKLMLHIGTSGLCQFPPRICYLALPLFLPDYAQYYVQICQQNILYNSYYIVTLCMILRSPLKSYFEAF